MNAIITGMTGTIENANTAKTIPVRKPNPPPKSDFSLLIDSEFEKLRTFETLSESWEPRWWCRSGFSGWWT